MERKDHLQVIDLFAGRARLARLARALGYAAVALDKDFDVIADNIKTANAMDLCTSAGFVSLACFKALLTDSCLSV